MLVTGNETDVGFDFACFLDGVLFLANELKKGLVRRVVNTRCS